METKTYRFKDPHRIAKPLLESLKDVAIAHIPDYLSICHIGNTTVILDIEPDRPGGNILSLEARLTAANSILLEQDYSQFLAYVKKANKGYSLNNIKEKN